MMGNHRRREKKNGQQCKGRRRHTKEKTPTKTGNTTQELKTKTHLNLNHDRNARCLFFF